MKRFLKLISYILALILPLGVLLAVVSASPDVYAQTYYAALGKQFDRLTSTTSPKVVLVGGSNVAFGMDSELFEELYGKNIVSFGLYGSFGTKTMMDLSKANLRRGDVVVLCPELTADAYSLYFGAESVWKGTEGRADVRSYVGSDNLVEMCATAYGFWQTKRNYLTSGDVLTGDGIYRNDAVNAFGEISSGLRKGNTMRIGYSFSSAVNYSPDIITDSFANFVNDYVDWCALRGVSVYFSFPPTNAKSVQVQNYTDDDIYAFYDALRAKVKCKVISDPKAYIFDYHYFYDTNFHLNDSGVVLRTAQLARDLILEDGANRIVKVEIPAMPEPDVATVEIDTTLDYTPSAYFDYEQDGDYLTIVGVKEQAVGQEEIVVPVYDAQSQKYITTIGQNAFSACSSLKTITIPVGISEICDNAFYGCSQLTKIRLLETSGGNVAVYRYLLGGVSSDCKLVVVNAPVSAFSTGYYWSAYADYLIKE